LKIALWRSSSAQKKTEFKIKTSLSFFVEAEAGAQKQYTIAHLMKLHESFLLK
jgi:uncharacterized protein YgiM (DUF1202 family)